MFFASGTLVHHFVSYMRMVKLDKYLFLLAQRSRSQSPRDREVKHRPTDEL
jgi:hypothetical protein